MTPPPHVSVFLQTRDALVKNFRQYREMVVNYQSAFENPEITPEMLDEITQGQSVDLIRKEFQVHRVQLSSMLLDYVRLFSNAVLDLSPSEALAQFDTSFGLISRIAIDRELFPVQHVSLVLQHAITTSALLLASIVKADPADIASSQLASPRSYQSLFTFFTGFLDSWRSPKHLAEDATAAAPGLGIPAPVSAATPAPELYSPLLLGVQALLMIADTLRHHSPLTATPSATPSTASAAAASPILMLFLRGPLTPSLHLLAHKLLELATLPRCERALAVQALQTLALLREYLGGEAPAQRWVEREDTRREVEKLTAFLQDTDDGDSFFGEDKDSQSEISSGKSELGKTGSGYKVSDSVLPLSPMALEAVPVSLLRQRLAALRQLARRHVTTLTYTPPALAGTPTRANAATPARGPVPSTSTTASPASPSSTAPAQAPAVALVTARDTHLLATNILAGMLPGVLSAAAQLLSRGRLHHALACAAVQVWAGFIVGVCADRELALLGINPESGKRVSTEFSQRSNPSPAAALAGPVAGGAGSAPLPSGVAAFLGRVQRSQASAAHAEQPQPLFAASSTPAASSDCLSHGQGEAVDAIMDTFPLPSDSSSTVVNSAMTVADAGAAGAVLQHFLPPSLASLAHSPLFPATHGDPLATIVARGLTRSSHTRAGKTAAQAFLEQLAAGKNPSEFEDGAIPGLDAEGAWVGVRTQQWLCESRARIGGYIAQLYSPVQQPHASAHDNEDGSHARASAADTDTDTNGDGTGSSTAASAPRTSAPAAPLSAGAHGYTVALMVSSAYLLLVHCPVFLRATVPPLLDCIVGNVYSTHAFVAARAVATIRTLNTTGQLARALSGYSTHAHARHAHAHAHAHAQSRGESAATTEAEDGAGASGAQGSRTVGKELLSMLKHRESALRNNSLALNSEQSFFPTASLTATPHLDISRYSSLSSGPAADASPVSVLSGLLRQRLFWLPSVMRQELSTQQLLAVRLISGYVVVLGSFEQQQQQVGAHARAHTHTQSDLGWGSSASSSASASASLSSLFTSSLHVVLPSLLEAVAINVHDAAMLDVSGDTADTAPAFAQTRFLLAGSHDVRKALGQLCEALGAYVPAVLPLLEQVSAEIARAVAEWGDPSAEVDVAALAAEAIGARGGADHAGSADVSEAAGRPDTARSSRAPLLLAGDDDRARGSLASTPAHTNAVPVSGDAEAAVGTEEELRQRVQAAVASLSAVPAEGFGGMSQRLIQMLTAARDKRHGSGAADGSHTGFSARSRAAAAPSAARYQYLCELCFLLAQLCLGLQRRVAYHAQMSVFHAQQQRHRAHVQQLRAQQASQGATVSVRVPPAPALPPIAAQFLLPPSPPPALALLAAPAAAAQGALLSVFTLPTAPARLAAEARYMVAHVAQRQLQPGLLYNADTYAHAQVAQAQAARACALLMSVLPPPSRVTALPRLLGPLLQAAQVSSAALQTNAQAALLFVARLCQFSSVEGLVRSYADQIVAELTTELSVMKTRTELEEAYRSGKIPGFSHSEAENPVSFGHTIVDVAEAVKRCRAAHDACKAAFGAVMVAAMATPQLTHAPSTTAAATTEDAARAGTRSGPEPSHTGTSATLSAAVGARSAPSDGGGKPMQRLLIEEIEEVAEVPVAAATVSGLSRGVLIEEVVDEEQTVHVAADAPVTLTVVPSTADSQRAQPPSGISLTRGQRPPQAQTEAQARVHDRVDTATPSSYAHAHAHAQAHAEASQALTRALREWREATRAAQQCIERYERAQARFERLPRLLVSTLTITQHTIDAGAAHTSHDYNTSAHASAGPANANQPSAPHLAPLGTPSPAAPMDMVPLLREALLQSVECLGSVLNKLQRLPKHIREWEIHANIEPGKMYFSGNLPDSQFSGAFGGESHAFSNGPREFVDPTRASSRDTFQRQVNAGDLSGVPGLALPPAEAARAWAQRAQCESDILRYLAMVLSICRAIHSRASYLWRRRRRVFALEYCRRWRGREMRRQWAERWALHHGADGAAPEAADTASVAAAGPATALATAPTVATSPEHADAAGASAAQPAHIRALQTHASSSALVAAPASVEELVAAQRRAHHVRLPAEDGIATMAVDVYVASSTIASAHADPNCTVLVDAEGIHLPRKDDIRKTVASFRTRLTSRVQRVREQEQERDRYARARAQGASATDMARVWWEELEQQRAREDEEKRRMGTLEDIGGDINYTAEDGARPADVEYDSDFDEEVTVGRQMTREERREVKRYRQGQWRGDEPSAFDTEHRRLRVAFKKETELTEAQRARVHTQGASRKSRPKSDGSSRSDADGKRKGKSAESAPVSKFGVHIAVVEDDDEDDEEEAQEMNSTTTVPPAHGDDAQGATSAAGASTNSAGPASAYDDPRCPYLPPGQDPYLDDPYWITPPAQDAGAVAEDGTRAASAEEALLERVLQQLQPLLLWPSLALRSKAAEVNCVAVAALGICGRVWPELENSGGFSGTVLSVREIIRERKRAERAALRKLQGLPEKKKNRFAGMVYGREGWSVDEPVADTDDDDDDVAEAETAPEKASKASTPASGRSVAATSTPSAAGAQASSDAADAGDVRTAATVSSARADAELQEWDFYKNPEKEIFPDEIPEPPLPVQHDIRLLPILSSLWLSLRFLLSPQHAILTDKHADGDGASPAPFNPTLGSSLALLAVVVAASPNFLASRFTSEVWPALQRLLLRCAALALPSPRTLAADRYNMQHAQRQSYATAFPPAHSPTYRVLVLCLCALRHCLLTADTARPLAAPILHTVLPFMAPHVPAEVRALVASIVAMVFVHDAATVTAVLHNICLALGVSQPQLEALTAAVARATAPATEEATMPVGGSRTAQRLARSYAAYEPPQPLVAESAVCPVNSLTQLAVRMDSAPIAAPEVHVSPVVNDAAPATAAPSCPPLSSAASMPLRSTIAFVRPSTWLRGFAALTEAVEQGRIVGDGSCSVAGVPTRASGSRLSAAREPVSNTVDLAHVSLQVYHHLQHAHAHAQQRANAVGAEDADTETSVNAGFASVLCVAELLSLLDQLKTGQLIPSGYYGSHL